MTKVSFAFICLLFALENLPLVAQTAESAVTTAGNQRLTATNVNDLVELIEFLIGGKISPDEKRAMTQFAIQEFHKDPATEANGYRDLNLTIQKLRRMQNPVERARLRQKLWPTVYFGAKEKKLAVLLDVLQRHSRVLAEDPASKTLVTSHDVEALFASNDFVAQLAGRPSLSREQKPDLVARLPKIYSALSAQQKEFLRYGDLRWTALRTVWPRLSEQRRQGLAAVMKETVKNPQQVPEAARVLETRAMMIDFQMYISRTTAEFGEESLVKSAVLDALSNGKHKIQ